MMFGADSFLLLCDILLKAVVSVWCPVSTVVTLTDNAGSSWFHFQDWQLWKLIDFGADSYSIVGESYSVLIAFVTWSCYIWHILNAEYFECW
jgi:hypothetical protein